MERHESMQAETFTKILGAWRGQEVEIAELIADDYVGHMLHSLVGDRTKTTYRSAIDEFRLTNPGTTFSILDQSLAGDRLWTRLQACREDGAVASGMNVCRFAGEQVAEEWAIWSAWRTT